MAAESEALLSAVAAASPKGIAGGAAAVAGAAAAAGIGLAAVEAGGSLQLLAQLDGGAQLVPSTVRLPSLLLRLIVPPQIHASLLQHLLLGIARRLDIPQSALTVAETDP